MKIKFTPLLSGICLATVLLLPVGAMAISYDITVDHSSGSGLGTPPFGTVTLNQNGTSVDFTVHLNTGYNFVLTGAADFMDFKFNATGVALGDITITQNAPETLVAQTGSFNGDGTGAFGFGITGTNQKNGGAGAFSSDIIFDVSNATITDFTQPNNLGFLFVVDIISPSGGATGPAAVVPSVRSVPDGGTTALLLGASLTGIALIRRKLARV